MKILHVISSLDPKKGGVSQALRTMISSLSQPGLINEAVCVDDSSVEFILNDKFTIYALGPAKTSWQYSPKISAWLKQNLTNYKVIIVHGLWQFPSYSTYKVWSKLKIKPMLFVMPHGMLDPYFQNASTRKLKAARNWIYWKLIENKIINKSNGLLFTCAEECRLAKLPFKPYAPKAEKVVGLAIENPPEFTLKMTDQFLQKCPGVKDKPYLLFLGRIDEKKGVDLLVEAYEKIILEKMESKKDVPCLVIAGPGLETSFGNAIKLYLSKNKLLKNSIFLPGMLSGDSKWAAFYGCDAFILPSHQENFGIAVVEALACSKPVLLSNKINIWNEIEKDGAGIIEDDSKVGTYQLMAKWLNKSAEEKNRMGSMARECYKNHFSMKHFATKLHNELHLNNKCIQD